MSINERSLPTLTSKSQAAIYIHQPAPPGSTATVPPMAIHFGAESTTAESTTATPPTNTSAHANVHSYFATHPCKTWSLEDFAYSVLEGSINERIHIWIRALHTIRDCTQICCPSACTTKARNLLLAIHDLDVHVTL